MGTTSILQITDTDVMIQLNGLQDIGLPLVGGGYGAAESVVMGYANRAEAVVLSTIPEMYRQMTREIKGETVVEMAYSGQTTFTLGLFPVVTGSLALYLDFGQATSGFDQSFSNLPAVNRYSTGGGAYGTQGRIPYSFRDVYDRMASTKYSVDNATGVVTLLDGYTLRGGSKLYADYQHEGMSRCHNLRDIAIRLAAANFGTSLAGITDGARDFLMQLESNAMNQLYALMRGEAGIDMLDQIKLVDETRQGGKIPRRGFSLFM